MAPLVSASPGASPGRDRHKPQRRRSPSLPQQNARPTPPTPHRSDLTRRCPQKEPGHPAQHNLQALTPDLTPHEKGEKSHFATPLAATPDHGKGNQVRSASSFHTRFSIPLTARPGESLAPTETSPTYPTGNLEDLAREHLGSAPLRTLLPTLPIPTSPTDPGEQGSSQHISDCTSQVS